jgi:hypothetical protein
MLFLVLKASCLVIMKRRLVVKGESKLPVYATGEFEWTVFDPRGQKLKTEKGTLGQWGSFHLKYKFPDNVNLGDGRVQFHLLSDPDKSMHTHSFQLQEFRRPGTSERQKSIDIRDAFCRVQL